MRNALIGASVGVELEYVGEPDLVAGQLADAGWVAAGGRHSYHCHCATCHYTSGLMFRYQNDSTVSGEFITRVLYDWPTANLAFGMLETAIKRVNRKPKGWKGMSPWEPPVSVSERTGLHVHVGGAVCDWSSLTMYYLLYERWMQRIGSGPFADKRDGMNITFLSALREQNYRPNQTVNCWDAAAACGRQVQSDRHIDLNFSRANGTYEFRVFNGTMNAWQMELAVRLSVAFSRVANNGQLAVAQMIRIPALPIQTLHPPIPLDEFVRALTRVDPLIGPLIERQLALHPRVEEPEPEPEPEPEESDFVPFAPTGSMRIALDADGAVLGCWCEACSGLRSDAADAPNRRDASDSCGDLVVGWTPVGSTLRFYELDAR